MKKDFSLIGLGICAWLTIISIAYTIKLVLIDLFIIYEIKFNYIHLLTELFYNSLIAIGFYIFLSFLKNKTPLNYSKIIINLIICFIVIQGIQFLYTLKITDYIYENYHDSWSSFNYFEGIHLNNYAFAIGEIFRYFVIGILFYKFCSKDD